MTLYGWKVTVGLLESSDGLRYGTGYQTVWETWPSAETPSVIHWVRFYFQLTCVHSALELSGQCTLQVYLLTSAALAARPLTNGFQDIYPRLSFIVRHRSCVRRWQMYAAYRRWPASSAVCWQSNMLAQEITQPVRWLLFCHCGAYTVEQSAGTASTTGHHLRTIQTITENVYVWLVGPWRSVSEH